MKKLIKCMFAIILASIMCATAILATPSFAYDVDTFAETNSNSEGQFFVPFTPEDAAGNFADYASSKLEYNMSTYSSITNQPAATIVGKIYDNRTYAPITNATVRIVDLDAEIQVDSKGAFEFSGVPEGQYSIAILANGYISALYKNMPAYSSSGAEFYYLPLSMDEELSFDYNATKDPTGNSDYIQPLNETAEPRTTSYSLKSYTVNYKGNIYSFGNNINEYLYFVVPTEMYFRGSQAQMSDTQKLEAYKAQAVASRGYADAKVRQGSTHSANGYSLCSETHCQVFVPYYTNANAIKAVNATSNQVMTYDGYRSPTEFHASCNGTTTNYPIPGNTSTSYVKTCVTHSVYVNSHNRGMCQTGAAIMASTGKTYRQILDHYYSPCELITASPIGYEGIDPGETIRFTPSANGNEFITYAPVSGRYTFSIKQTGSSSYSANIEVFNMTRTNVQDVDPGTSIAVPTAGTLTVSLTAGKEYIVKVTPTASSRPTSARLSIKCNPACPSVNVGLGDSKKNQYYIVNVTEKILKFTPTTTGTYSIQTVQGDLGQSYDTYLEVRNQNFVLLSSDDNSGSGNYSSITRSFTGGNTYYIVVTTSGNHSSTTSGQVFQCGLKITKQ